MMFHQLLAAADVQTMAVFPRFLIMFIVGLLFHMPLAAIVLCGALKMRRLEAYGLAIAASILAMLPCHLGFPVGLPVGIWALIVLSKPEVKAAFNERKRQRAAGGPSPVVSTAQPPVAGNSPAAVLLKPNDARDAPGALDSTVPSRSDPSEAERNNIRRWPEMVFVACLILVLAAVALYSVVPRFLMRPVGTILVYEIDPATPVGGEVVQRMIEVIDRRINHGALVPEGKIRTLGTRRIEVQVYGNDPMELDRLKRRIEVLGTLEFRIVANRRDHAALIATAEETGEQELRRDGKPTARWVPAEKDVAESIRGNPNFASRTNPAGEFEVLVCIDRFNVTGDYLESAVPGVDARGRPAIEFQFDARGAALFGAMTSANLPDSSGFSRQLAILLNGRVMAAPSIQCTITDRGEITGNFTREEVEDLVGILNAGRLPAPLRFVRQTVVVP